MSMNGVMLRGVVNQTGHGQQLQQEERKYKSYKLITDPLLGRGKQKIIRYDGVIPGVNFLFHRHT